LGGSKAFLKPRTISTLKKELFHSPFSGGYAASFCGNSASAANAVEDKEAGGRAKAAAAAYSPSVAEAAGVAQGAVGAERRAGAREQVVRRGGVVARSGG